MKGEVKKYWEDLRFYRTEKRQLKKELETLKVSVAYDCNIITSPDLLHVTVPYV
jgi:hypothetical protein